jgi:glutamine synthetase
MMTALDRHREENARAGALDAIKEAITENGVEYVYYQAVTITGRVVGKVVPVGHLDRIVVCGVQQHRSAVSNLQSDRSGQLLGGGTEAAEYTAVPDLDTFAVLPWDRSIGRFFCRLYEPDHRARDAGAPLATDTRGLLKRLGADFTARTGLELRTGTEPEMTWEGPGLEAVFRPGSSPSYHIEHLERYRSIYQKVISYSRALGLDMIEGDYEDGGQLELNWMFDHADLTADRLVTYRQVCKQVARELGVSASFMPKPATGMMGNGCHHNFSLWRDDVNILAEPGRTELHLTDEGRHALGGVLQHSAGAMAILGPTVNSYKRYWDTGQFAPSRIDWGLDNKTCTVRLSANGRLEYKLPDAMVNPYLSHAVLVAAIQDGLKNRLDPGEPTVSSSYQSPLPELFGKLPLSLGVALDAFEADTYLIETLGAELCTLYLAYKRDEWARFCAAVTDWERNLYWEDLP